MCVRSRFRPWRVAFALAAGFVLSPIAAAAPGPAPIAGTARVLDGDTIEVTTAGGATVKIRLEGIDAPEGGQRCNRKWFLGQWDCGQAATHALRLLVEGRQINCDDRGLDKYARTLGVCHVDGRDINAAMVRAGLAWAFVRYSDLYVADEQVARAKKLGIWQAPTEAPWDWRAAQRVGSRDTASMQRFVGPPTVAEAAPADGHPPGCDIKGAVTRNGRIYHTTTSPWYERVHMSLGMGRRWFCTEAEAQAAGWRPVASR